MPTSGKPATTLQRQESLPLHHVPGSDNPRRDDWRSPWAEDAVSSLSLENRQYSFNCHRDNIFFNALGLFSYIGVFMFDSIGPDVFSTVERARPRYYLSSA